MVSIIITTCNRPAFLREALESVRHQIGLQSVAAVIVSENSLSTDSKDVCSEFADLPIVYLQQKPPVPAILHIKAIWHHVNTPLVAILHDDDWWEPDHLASALEVLNTTPECPAVYSNYYRTIGVRYPFQVSFGDVWAIWAASGNDFSKPILFLDDVGVMLSCLLRTSFHYSTLVCRRNPFWDAYQKVVATGNTFDNDRTFPVFLSTHGPLGYMTRPSAMVRDHPGQDWKQPEQGSMWIRMSSTTRLLLKTEPEKVRRAASRFNQQTQNLPVDQLLKYFTVGEPLQTTLIEECGLKLLPNKLPPNNKGVDAKNILRGLCPPFIWRGIRRVFHWFSSLFAAPKQLTVQDSATPLLGRLSSIVPPSQSEERHN